jgi:nucleoid-associated protein YgaU
MMKYGVVGAIALAVLVAAMWDGSKSRKKPADAGVASTADISSGDAAVTGEVGASTSKASLDPSKPSAPAVAEAPAPAAAAVAEDVLEKHQVHAGETLRAIARTWLGDEKLAEQLYDFNKSRIPDARHLSARLTLVFPRSKFAKKAAEVGTAGSGTAAAVDAGMKKDEIKATTEPAGDKKYVVKEGDTLYGIAKRELGKGSRWEEIATLNNLDGNMVKKGQTLLMPAK